MKVNSIILTIKLILLLIKLKQPFTRILSGWSRGAVILVHQLLPILFLKIRVLVQNSIFHFTLGVDQMLTVGFEGAHSSLDDDASMTQLLGGRRDKTGKVLYDLKRTPTNRHLKCTRWS